MAIILRHFTPPDRSFFLFGPRGTGKSTLIRGAFPQALHLDLLDPATYRRLSARPETLREEVAGLASPSVVVLDEIQKLPVLLDVVHALIERHRTHRFILLGSSSRKLKRSGADLLAGRAIARALHPFMATELGDRFSLVTALQMGTLPVVVDSPDPQDVLQAYAAYYLREEVQMEGIVRSVDNFSRFLEAASFSHASVLNVSNVARECEVSRKTVESYLSILEDLLLSYRLPVFTRRAQRALAAHPKFYLFDAGVYRSLRPRGPLDRSEEIEGAALEGLVGQHLRAWVDYGERDARLFYWRTREGAEVDFVVYGGQTFAAMEVKNSTRLRPNDLRSLKAFRSDYPESDVCLLYRGQERLVRDGILVLPVEGFLQGLHPAGRLLPEVHEDNA